MRSEAEFKYPNLIIISQEIPHNMAAGAILLYRLLADWPGDRLAVCGPPPPERAERLKCRYVNYKPRINRIQYSRLSPLAAPMSWLLPLKPPSVAMDGPTVVLSVMQSAVFFRAARDYARRFNLPLALIIHDDPEEIEPVRNWTRPLVRHFNKSIYQEATARFCVSHEMSEHLEQRYGKPGEVLYPSPSRTLTARPSIDNKALKRGRSSLVIGYAGTLAYGYGLRLAELLPIFRSNGVTLRVYSREKPLFGETLGVEYAGGFPPNLLWETVKSECDAVILPYCGPNDGHQELYRTHFPSKLPEYLSLGMPVIVTGPADATGVRWAQRNHPSCAVIEIGPHEQCQWSAMLTRLANDGNWRVELGSLARAASDREFAISAIEDVFVRRLADIANEGRLTG